MDQNANIQDQLHIPKKISLYNLIHIICVSICITVFIILDLVFHYDFMRESTKFSHSIFRTNLILNIYFEIFAIFFFGLIKIVPFLLLYFHKNKCIAIKILFLVFTEQIIAELIKLIYRDTRPCFQDNYIGRFNCSCSYGKASGHSSSSILFYFLIYFDIFKPLFLKSWIKILLFFSCAFIIINIWFSRIYLGAHSFNQVILGFFFGYFIFIIQYSFNDYLCQQIKCLFNIKPNEDLAQTFWKIYLIISFLIQAIIIFLFFIIVYKIENQSDFYLKNNNCGVKCLNNQYLSSNHLKSAGYVYLIQFIITLLLIKKPQESVQNETYYIQSFKQRNLISKRVITFIIISLPLIGIFLVQWLVNNLVGYLIILVLGFCYSLLFVLVKRRLMIKLGCETQGDLFIEQEQNQNQLSSDQFYGYDKEDKKIKNIELRQKLLN